MSNFFDPEDKKNKPIIDYFESKSWLIIDVSSSIRTSIKKSLVQLGAKISNMLDADNFVDAANIIDSKKPQFVIGHKNIHGGHTTALFKNHLKAVPDRLNAGFFVVADPAVSAEIALELEYDMDGIITLPFTGAAIIDTVLSSVKEKIMPTPYLTKINEGRANFILGKLEQAQQCFAASIAQSKIPYEGFYFIGDIHAENNNSDKALISYEESLKINNEFFKTLNRLHSIYYNKKDYKKAYKINVLMAKKFPTPPSRIPELIRLSIVNEKYEDINNYLNLYGQIKNPDVSMQIYISAGLAILGKYFINKNEIDKAINALRDAFRFSNGKYEILKNISNSFEECQKMDILYELFQETDLNSWPANIQALYFYACHLTSKDDFQVIAMGEQLLKRKIKDVIIYKGLIERSVKIKRKTLETLLMNAINDFPENKIEFENLIQKTAS